MTITENKKGQKTFPHEHDNGFFITAALAPLDPEFHYCSLCREYIKETFHGSGVAQ